MFRTMTIRTGKTIGAALCAGLLTFGLGACLPAAATPDDLPGGPADMYTLWQADCIGYIEVVPQGDETLEVEYWNGRSTTYVARALLVGDTTDVIAFGGNVSAITFRGTERPYSFGPDCGAPV